MRAFVIGLWRECDSVCARVLGYFMCLALMCACVCLWMSLRPVCVRVCV